MGTPLLQIESFRHNRFRILIGNSVFLIPSGRMPSQNIHDAIDRGAKAFVRSLRTQQAGEEIAKSGDAAPATGVEWR